MQSKQYFKHKSFSNEGNMNTVIAHRIEEHSISLLSSFCIGQEQEISKKKKKKKSLEELPSKEVLLERIKNLCKTAPEAPEILSRILLKCHLSETKNLEEKANALQCVEELFKRSAKFRNHFCGSFNVFLTAVFKDTSEHLRNQGTHLLRSWHKQFGQLYPQIYIAMKTENIEEEKDVEEKLNAEQVIRQQVDLSQTETIIRGFRIYDGTPLTGDGESVANLLHLCFSKLSEVDTCLEILLPYLRGFAEENDDLQEKHLKNEEDNNDDDDEWESEGDQEKDYAEKEDWSQIVAKATSYLPENLTIKLTSTSAESHDDDVREALLDCRLTIEKTIIPEVTTWTESLERCVVELNQHEHKVVLVRVKNLLRDLSGAIAKCDRLEITPRKRRKYE